MHVHEYWSVHVVAKYKNRYENNTQYPFYTVAVKRISVNLNKQHYYVGVYMPHSGLGVIMQLLTSLVSWFTIH